MAAVVKPTPERVVARALNSLVPIGDCLVSRYSTGSHGYAQIGWHEDGKTHMRLVHRVVWEAVHGPIPDDLTVDHIKGVCVHKKCARLSHLRLLPNADNARMNGHWAKIQCPVGHPYTGENLRVDPKGHRHCKACDRRHATGRPAPTHITRDEDCPQCGWPETYAEVDFTRESPGADAFGCSKCGWFVEAVRG